MVVEFQIISFGFFLWPFTLTSSSSESPLLIKENLEATNYGNQINRLSKQTQQIKSIKIGKNGNNQSNLISWIGK